MNADRPEKTSKRTGGEPGSEPPAATTPNQPHRSSDPAAAIAAIAAIRKLALTMPDSISPAEAIAAIEALAESAPGAKSAALEAITTVGTGPADAAGARARKRKRAICLAGGGPAG